MITLLGLMLVMLIIHLLTTTGNSGNTSSKQTLQPTDRRKDTFSHSFNNPCYSHLPVNSNATPIYRHGEKRLIDHNEEKSIKIVTNQITLYPNGVMVMKKDRYSIIIRPSDFDI